LITVGTGDGWEAAPYLRTILQSIAAANRCASVMTGYNVIRVYGIGGDPAWVESLFTRVYFDLVSKINPKYDAGKSYDESVYNFRVSGMAWPDIDAAITKAGGPSKESTKSRERHEHWAEYGSGWMKEPKREVSKSIIAAYRRHAELIGDENLVTTGQHGTYRRGFMEGFRDRVCRRVHEMREAANHETSGSGAEVALRDAMEDILGAIGRDFPGLSPEERAEAARRAKEAREREAREREEMLDAMTDKQREAFLEKEERKHRKESARNARYWSDLEGKRDSSAIRRGARAGDEVDLSKTDRVKTETATRTLHG